jgi:hypothetical protein
VALKAAPCSCVPCLAASAEAIDMATIHESFSSSSILSFQAHGGPSTSWNSTKIYPCMRLLIRKQFFRSCDACSLLTKTSRARRMADRIGCKSGSLATSNSVKQLAEPAAALSGVTPLEALDQRSWVKLICGASFEVTLAPEVPTVTHLLLRSCVHPVSAQRLFFVELIPHVRVQLSWKSSTTCGAAGHLCSQSDSSEACVKVLNQLACLFGFKFSIIAAGLMMQLLLLGMATSWLRIETERVAGPSPLASCPSSDSCGFIESLPSTRNSPA